jgi:hypothetical protein
MNKGLFILTILIAFLGRDCIAQVKYTKEQKYLKKEADYIFGFGDYPTAKAKYLELFAIDSLSVELNHKIAVCILLAEHDRKESKPYFEFASGKGYIESDYYIAGLYHLENNFDRAAEYFRKYLASTEKKQHDYTTVRKKLDMVERARKMIASPVEVRLENIGPTINTKYHEYVPVISADESVLIFTSRRPGSTGGKLDPFGRHYEDIYISVKQEGKWSRPEGISPNINTDNYDACVGLSSDGFTLIIYKTNEDYTGGDLYWTTLDGDEWQVAEKYGEGINSANLEPSASLSADGNKIYFSSNRPGGYGGLDIYRAVKFPDGKWSLPQNLGPAINTEAHEDAPFIHPDDKTLYFSSQAHETMGGYDIFKSEVDENGAWSKPKNLGYPINTTDDDRYFVLSADGRKGYYSSGKDGGFGEHDIYEMHLPHEFKDLTLVKGVISADNSTKQALKAKITLRDAETKKIVGIYHSNSKTGKYLLVIPPDEKLKMTVYAGGYGGYSETLFFHNKEGFNKVIKDIKLKPLVTWIKGN